MWQFKRWVIRLWFHLFAPRWSVGALVILRDEAGRILLAHHRHHSKPWGLPGGFVQWPETPAQGAARELTEELGLSLSHDELLPCTTLVSERLPLLEVLFQCTRPLRPDEIASIRLKRDELVEVDWFDAAAIREHEGMLARHRGAITDLMSISTSTSSPASS